MWNIMISSHIDTVNGRNLAPLGMVETCRNPRNNGVNHLSAAAGFLPSTVAYEYIDNWI